MKIKSLTSVRAFAALFVIIHHYGSNLKPFSLFGKLFHSGNLSVGFFFVLSGFVLSLSTTILNTKEFYLKRFLRISPAYYAALLIMTVVMIVLYPVTYTELSKHFVSSMFFIQAFNPKHTLELNSPAWSVSNEMFFYLLFPAFFSLRNKRKTLLFITIVIYIISQIIHLYYAPKTWALSGSGIYFNPMLHLNQFLIGMTGGVYFKDYRRLFAPKYITYLSFTTIIILMLIRPDNISYNNGLIAPLYLLLIFSLAAHDSWWINARPLVFIGEISYGLYIYQMPIFFTLFKINERQWHVPETIMFCIALTSLFFVTIISYLYIEKKTLK